MSGGAKPVAEGARVAEAERIVALILESFPHLGGRADGSRGSLTLSDGALLELCRQAFRLVVGGLTAQAASAELSRMSVSVTSEDGWVRAGDVLQRLREAAGLGSPPAIAASSRPEMDPELERWKGEAYDERRASVDRAMALAEARGDGCAMGLIAAAVDRDPELEGRAVCGFVTATLLEIGIVDVEQAAGGAA